MITSDHNDAEDSTSSPATAKSILMGAAAMLLIAAMLGSVLGSALSIALGSHELLSATTVGFVFGGWIGLVVGLLFGSIRRLRELRKRSGKKTVLVFTLIAAIAGAVLSFPFSEGLAMALYLALEGAVAGGLIGFLLAIIERAIGNFRNKQRAAE